MLQTPLLGADDAVYAVAQGAILLGGFLKVVETLRYKKIIHCGDDSGGAIVEAEIPTTVIKDGALTCLLKTLTMPLRSN